MRQTVTIQVSGNELASIHWLKNKPNMFKCDELNKHLRRCEKVLERLLKRSAKR